MTRVLSVERVLLIYRYLMEQSGGASGLRDRGALEAAVAQPLLTFGGADLYPSLTDKAAALGFSLIQNHPFIDGNKRIGHAAMAIFLALNGFAIQASVDDQEALIIGIASGQIGREDLANWLVAHLTPRAES